LRGQGARRIIRTYCPGPIYAPDTQLKGKLCGRVRGKLPDKVMIAGTRTVYAELQREKFENLHINGLQRLTCASTA